MRRQGEGAPFDVLGGWLFGGFMRRSHSQVTSGNQLFRSIFSRSRGEAFQDAFSTPGKVSACVTGV